MGDIGTGNLYIPQLSSMSPLFLLRVGAQKDRLSSLCSSKPPPTHTHIQASNEVPIPNGQKEQGRTQARPIPKDCHVQGLMASPLASVDGAFAGLGAEKTCSYHSSVFSWIWCLFI